MKPSKIVYPVVPSRFNDETWDKILDFIRIKGYVPFDHRRGVPYKDFELGLGRAKTLDFLIRVMKQCDAVWIFGISEGAMGELKVAIEMKEGGSSIEILGFYNFDPEWDKYYEKLRKKYGDLIAHLRGKRRLIILVGPRAVGKTFWSDKIISIFGNRLGRIKNTTTRPPRDEKDHLSYRFVSKRVFKQEIREGKFLEYDKYRGRYYGSSVDSIMEVLANQDGIFAITPNGAARLYENRFGINLTIILLRAQSDETLIRNFISRGIVDKLQQEKLLLEAHQFCLPLNVPHIIVELSGDENVDQEQLIRAIYPDL